MKDIDRLAQSVQMLVNGWHERTEYKVVTHTCHSATEEHESGCRRTTEDRVKNVRHAALLVQLHEAVAQSSNTHTADGTRAGKPSSRPPGNMAPLHLIDVITEEAEYQYQTLATIVNGTVPSVVRTRKVTQTLHNLVAVALSAHEYTMSLHHAAQAAHQWVRKSRVLLGYEQPHVLLNDMVCGSCGGALAVARDASSEVHCIGTPAMRGCGQKYPQWQWLDLLGGGT